MRENPASRDELQAVTGASGPTVGRILGDFEDHGWVSREAHEYTLTKPGIFVADQFKELYDGIETEMRLRNIRQWLSGELGDFEIEFIVDAKVTNVEPGDPYGPANRCASPYRETEYLRGFDAALTAPYRFEELYHQFVEGMDTEIIFPPDVSKKIASAYSEKAVEVIESDSFTLCLHDSLPLYRVLIYEDHVGVGGYDPENGVLQVYVDTQSPAARSWLNLRSRNICKKLDDSNPHSIAA